MEVVNMDEQADKNKRNLIRISVIIGVLSMMIIIAAICLTPRINTFTQTLEMTKVDSRGNHLGTVEVTVEVTELHNVFGAQAKKLSFAAFDGNRAFTTTNDDFDEIASHHYLFAANKVYVSIDPNVPSDSINAYIYISFDYELWLIKQYQKDGSAVFYVVDTSGQKTPAAIRTYFGHSTSY